MNAHVESEIVVFTWPYICKDRVHATYNTVIEPAAPTVGEALSVKGTRSGHDTHGMLFVIRRVESNVQER